MSNLKHEPSFGLNGNLAGKVMRTKYLSALSNILCAFSLVLLSKRVVSDSQSMFYEEPKSFNGPSDERR
jgi:hypothetical protein